MKILKIALIVFWVILFAGVFGFIWVVKKAGEGMSNNAIHFSKGILESKKNNLFLYSYRPFKDSLKLDNLKIKPQKIWFEKRWNMDNNKINIFSGVNIILPDTSLLSDKVKVSVFYKEPKSNYKDYSYQMDVKDGLGYTSMTDSIPDTLTLLFRTNYPDAGYVDSIKYIRE